MPLGSGDPAPEFTLAAVIDDKIGEATLETLLEGRLGVVLHTYPLDFTGG